MTKTQKGNIKIVGFVKAKAEVLSRKTVLHIDVFISIISQKILVNSQEKKSGRKNDTNKHQSLQGIAVTKIL